MTTATVAAKPAKQPKPLPAPNSDFYEGSIGLRHAVLQALLAGDQARIFTEPYGECRFAKPALGRRFAHFAYRTVS
jgi:hypothetical protein